MSSASFLSRTRNLLLDLVELTKVVTLNRGKILSRSYAKGPGKGCRRALVDIPQDVDPLCPDERAKSKKKGILHRIKLRIIEGGTNFGTPFRWVPREAPKKVCKPEPEPEPKALPPPKKKVVPMPESREGVQVSVLGADTPIGQYVALLLKQCPCIKKLRLYEATDACCECNRGLGSVVQDLHNIDTNCRVQAFSCSCCELERCLQNTDIVLILESGYLNCDMPFEKRFCYQAPIIKHYTDCIATECPKAFVICCASPIDCMVPLIAETMKETGWYDPRKIFGSMAVPEMRASTLAARALCLEPRYTRVPCVGGTEGESLVPLFSKAVEYFDFATHNALLMTDAVRHAPSAVARSDGPCLRAADLSEAHAISGLVIKAAHALLCHDVPRVTGFVETDSSQIITPVSHLAMEVLLNKDGICKKFDLPARMNTVELELMDWAMTHLWYNSNLARTWHATAFQNECEVCCMQAQTFFGKRVPYEHVHNCLYQT